MSRWMKVAAKDKVAARLMLVIRALNSTDAEPNSGAVEMTLALGLGCSLHELRVANRVLREEGLASVQWMQ
jgi:hypothetical protein